MFCTCFDIGCVGTMDSKLGLLCVLKEGTIIQRRVNYVLYVH